jgi:Ca2+-binding RTX toxin-like protein
MDATRPRTLAASRRAASLPLTRRLGCGAVVMLMGFSVFGLAGGPAKAGVVTLKGSTLEFVSDDPNRPVNVTFSQSGNVVTISSPGDALSDPPAPCGYVGSDVGSDYYVVSRFDVIACDLTGVNRLAATGGPGRDRITIDSSLPATLCGGDGHDVLSGGAGNDDVDGAAGHDSLSGGPGNDDLRGDRSGPREGPPCTETPGSAPGADTLEGGPGDDHLAGNRREDYLDGEDGRDKLDGGPSADVVATRDRARDAPLSCGPGKDFAIVDPQDPIIRSDNDRCERIDDGTQRKPRPGRVYIKLQRCAGSGDDVELALPAMHRFVPLRYSILLPTGYQGRPAPTLDPASCVVRLTATRRPGRNAPAAITGDAFAISQTARRRLITTLTIKPPRCATRARSAPPRGGRRARKLRQRTGDQKDVQVKGKSVIVGSPGTDWTTVDRCRSTTTIVHHGRVFVFDFRRRRVHIVNEGHRLRVRVRGRYVREGAPAQRRGSPRRPPKNRP